MDKKNLAQVRVIQENPSIQQKERDEEKEEDGSLHSLEEIKLFQDINGRQERSNMFNLEKNNLFSNILFIGDRSVGKTCLINLICDGYAKNRYTQTLACESRQKKIKFGNNMIHVRFLDLGIFDFELNIPAIIDYMKMSHGVVYVADSNDHKSLAPIQNYAALLKNESFSPLFSLLVLNKTDLNEESIVRLNPTSKDVMILNENLHLNCICESSLYRKDTVQAWFSKLLQLIADSYAKNSNIFKEKFNYGDGKALPSFKYRKAKIKQKYNCCY